MNNPTSMSKLDQLLVTATELFFRFGIRRISVEEICRKANVSKMTFYKHFPNKMELMKHILNSMFDASMQEYHEIMSADMPYIDKVRQILELKLHQTKDMGREFFHELLDEAAPEIKELVEQRRAESFQTLIDDFDKAQQRGDIRPEINLQFLIYMLNHMTEMGSDDYLLGLYDKPSDVAMELTNFFFYGILPPRGDSK